MPKGIYVRTEETKKILSEAKKGHFVSEETKKKLSETHKGKSFSEEAKRRMSEAKKGKHYPKISEAHKGKHHSEETKRKIGEACKGKPGGMLGKRHSEEARKKMSEAQKGKHLPEAVRRKMSEAHWKGGKKMTWARRSAKRREFDFIPLNKPFEGADAHHIDKNYVIYIPKEVHQSIYHSVLKNINMDEINAVAFNYL